MCRRLTTGPPSRHWRDPQAGPAKRCKGPLQCDEPRKDLPVKHALPAADWRLPCGTFNSAIPDSLMSPPLTSTLSQPLLPYQHPILASVSFPLATPSVTRPYSRCYFQWDTSLRSPVFGDGATNSHSLAVSPSHVWLIDLVGVKKSTMASI